MAPRLVSPEEAVDEIARSVKRSQAERVVAELAGEPHQPLVCRLRPGVSTSADVARLGFESWHAWRAQWNHAAIADLVGVRCVSAAVTVRGVPHEAPLELQVDDLDAALRLLDRFGAPQPAVGVAELRAVGERLTQAGARATAGELRAVGGLPEPDFDALLSAITWLRDHDDLGQWTVTQLPVPHVHTKWIADHEALVRRIAGRAVLDEVEPRPSIVHLTYVDPTYLATGGRRHDAWTTGDTHQLAYTPRVVLVVENRDCRLTFPEMPGTVVVEGEGSAASSLAAIDWIANAERVVYWGDIDCDGFAILDRFRAELRQRGKALDSMLMTEQARSAYADLGVNHDKHGTRLGPSRRRLHELTAEESACYAHVATAGDVAFRRIEQERIPMPDAAIALTQVLTSAPPSPTPRA
ncbi:Wadjet anti-phage system protein JetD domain-containing protein [Microbacterium sp. NPDC056044]|uniref:Wadjet anti-phage system protein JetD domain-containing protein n=1 Tax=Microbacterium sp. NPDC056044 TaxID=3345690 RepID=UPI0035DB2FB1